MMLLLMMFLHVIDDFYLQGILASLKQKSYWKENAPEPIYKYDYIVALLMHSFSWTFMIMLPHMIQIVIYGGTWCLSLYLMNFVIHAFVDDLKANKKSINLIVDQSIHIFQIIFTYIVITSEPLW